MEDESILIEGRAKPFCSLCNIGLANDNAKTIKQHLKSKTHKQNQKNLETSNDATSTASTKASKKKGKGRKHHSSDSDSEDTASDELEKPCEICQRLGITDTRHGTESYAQAVNRGESVWPCMPPPFVASPKSLFPKCRTPFLTVENGWIPEVPDNLEDCLELYCNAGTNEGNKPPNIDVQGENIKTKSLANARRALLQAEAAGQTYWAALVVDSIKHPVWWPRPKENVCVGDGDVPCFNQVIIGSGATDIGIHIDNAPRPQRNCISLEVELQVKRQLIIPVGLLTLDLQEEKSNSKLDFVDVEDKQINFCLSAGEHSVHVDTYITMARGKKFVIMLPPNQNFFEPKAPFPRNVDPDLLSKISEAGGYYFALQPIDDETPSTVFTPRGWHHWLLGASEWHLIFGASRF